MDSICNSICFKWKHAVNVGFPVFRSRLFEVLGLCQCCNSHGLMMHHMNALVRFMWAVAYFEPVTFKGLRPFYQCVE